MTMEGDGFKWEKLVPHIIHPLKVTILEAMLWIDQPLSSTDLVKVIDDEEFPLSNISYHVRKLLEAGAIKEVRNRQVRGATETFYFFS
jgi:predicted MarR family transcription regulator